MISFRYHLVSVIGIFLAIALGVVVGATALNGAVVGDLRRQNSDLKDTNAAQKSANAQLKAEAGNADLLARSFGGKIAGGALAKQSTIVVSLPGASSQLATDTITAITNAGGAVTGQIQFTKALTDPDHATDIKSLATSASHPVGLQLPTTDDAGTLAGSLLGFVLFGKGQATDLTQVLAGFSGLNMVKVVGKAPVAARSVVILAPGTVSPTAAPALLSLVKQLQSGGGATVVAGDATSARSGLVSLVRADSDARAAVTAVDDADSDLGQLTVVLAAAEAIAGRPGQFGTAAGDDALIPGAAG